MRKFTVFHLAFPHWFCNREETTFFLIFAWINSTGMSLPDFIKSRQFLKHFALSILLTLVIVFLIIQSLGFYTRHGQSVEVPDFIGKTMVELEQIADNSDFEFVVVDSVWDSSKPKGTVLMQDPLPMAKVKNSRTIYITMVATQPEKISMPNLVDLTIRQAMSLLETYGLQIGSLQYRPDIAKNAVLKQLYKGQEIEPGKMLLKGSTIDLVLGTGNGSGKAIIPFLIGKKQSEVKKILMGASLNIGKEVFMDGMDTVHSRVYMQSPKYTGKPDGEMGQSIDLWYRSDKKVDFEELSRSYLEDSLTNQENTTEE